MDMLESDASLTKSVKKKKDMDEQMGNNNRKISDFFKIPDKQVEKQKQKNLLQFFTKSAQMGEGGENVDENNVTSVDEMNVTGTGTEITTLTSSDKENVQVHEDNSGVSDKEASKTKAKKIRKSETDSESSNDESGSDKAKLKHSGNESEKTEMKVLKKHKLKRKPKDERANNSLSSSIILLSDSSLSNSPNTDCNHGCILEADQSADTGNDDDKFKTENEVNCKQITGKEMSDKTETENKVPSGKSEVENDMEAVEVDTVDIVEGSSKVRVGITGTGIHEKQKKKQKKSIEVKEKNLKFDLLNSGTSNVKQIDEEMSNIVDSKRGDKEPVEQPNHEKRKSKKSALKGKDMLNLLKEIQSVESEDCKKKKHHKKRHKHKIKEKLATEVIEIAVSEDNSDGKDEVKETRNLKIEICDKANGSEKPIDSNNVKTETDGVAKSISRKSKKSKFANSNKAINGKLTETEKDSKKDKLKKKNHGIGELSKEEPTISGVSYVLENIHKLSYDIFSKKLTNSKSETNDDKKCDSAKEMSYTEYLKLMEKSHNCDDVDMCDKDVEMVNVEQTEAIADGNKDVQKNYVGSGKDILEGECKALNSTKNKFFTVMTSTPGKEKKGTKSADRMLGKEIVDNVGKSKKNSKVRKDKTKNKETDCEIIESISKLKDELVIKTNNCKIDLVNTKIEIEKADIPAKCLFSGNKTQATLSFGKTGLKVSKPETRIEDDMPKENDEPSNKCNKKTKTIDKTKKVLVKIKNAKTIVRQSRKDTVYLTSTDSSVFATPDKPRRRKGKRKIDMDVDSESTDSGDRRRSLRKRYKVEGFQMDADMKTPIKIKLRRCPKSSSSCEDIERLNVSAKNANVKQTTAFALLEKAKRGKLKKHKIKKDKKSSSSKVKETKTKNTTSKSRNESNSSEDSVTRRSSRLEGKVMPSMEEVSLENIVISSSEDEVKEEIKVKKRRKPKGTVNVKKDGVSEGKEMVKKDTNKPKGTPKKNDIKKKAGTPSKKRTPSKKTGKLAPMFLLGKNKPVEPSPKKPPIDPELAKQRQEFLMSGLPEELRKQIATKRASHVVADYPPIPTISHVLQVPTDFKPHGSGLHNVWDLNPVELSERRFIVPSTIYPVASFNGDLMITDDTKLMDLNKIKSFQHHVAISDDIVELCLKEISFFNSGFPVTAMYKALKEMKTQTVKAPPESDSMLKTDMKGILAGCIDTIVVDEEQDKGKKRKRKGLKLQRKEEQMEKMEEPKPQDKPTINGSSLLWTEKYCPAATADVLGNCGVVKKLKTWLTDWKQVLDREARNARKLLMKKNKGKQLPVGDELWDDDSDFDLGSEDSDEENSLCNTVLLMGPHGCGKTSSVYALALELGFKVHEVNASACRSGKQIVSQLQEATQSHQVTSHTIKENTGTACAGDKPKPQNNKMPTSFTNLFKKAASTTENKLDEKLSGRTRNRHKSEKNGSQKSKSVAGGGGEGKHKRRQFVLEDTNSHSVSKSLYLSSTTLILFDEVDVVFEDDRGFLSAIQNFMCNTKIPIVLTTADPGFTDIFDGRYEHMNFKRPTVASITSHLQTVSLVENVRTDPVSLAELAQLYDCDIRKCLTTLQFLLESGGGNLHTCTTIQTTTHSHKTTDILGLETETSKTCLQEDQVITDKEKTENCGDVDNQRMCTTMQTTNHSHKTIDILGLETETSEKEDEVITDKEKTIDADNSDDDYMNIKPLKKRRRMLEDDHSNSVDNFSQVTLKVPAEVSAVDGSGAARSYPTVHRVGLESLLRSRELTIAESLTKGLMTESATSLQDMICSCSCVKRTSQTDLCYNNLHNLLPFTTQIVDSTVKVSPDISSKAKTRKRIKIQSDLYDSEASNEATEREESTTAGDEEKEDDVSKSGKNSAVDQLENMCLAKSLSCFSRFYDTMSALDVFETQDKMNIPDIMHNLSGRNMKGRLVAGVENELANHWTRCELDLESCRTYCSEIEARSMCKLYREIGDVKHTVGKLCVDNPGYQENFILPIHRQHEHFTLMDSSIISIPTDFRRACDNVVDSLPLVTHSHVPTIHLDYLPTVREICRTEQCRQLTNTKRRFHHYFDSITLPLKDKTISTLATTFV